MPLLCDYAQANCSTHEVQQQKTPITKSGVCVVRNMSYYIVICMSTQPGHPSVGRRNEHQPRDSDALRLGSKASMVREWVTGKTSCNSLAI